MCFKAKSSLSEKQGATRPNRQLNHLVQNQYRRVQAILTKKHVVKGTILFCEKLLSQDLVY